MGQTAPAARFDEDDLVDHSRRTRARPRARHGPAPGDAGAVLAASSWGGLTSAGIAGDGGCRRETAAVTSSGNYGEPRYWCEQTVGCRDLRPRPGRCGAANEKVRLLSGAGRTVSSMQSPFWWPGAARCLVRWRLGGAGIR